MQPSRRSAIGLVGTSILVPLVGCTTATSGNTPDRRETTQPPQTDAPFEVRLAGPETEQVLFDRADITSVGDVRQRRSGATTFRITISDAASAAVTNVFETRGVAETPDDFEIVQVYRGDVAGRFGITPALARTIANGEWDGEFLVAFETRQQATDIREALVE